MRRTGHNVMSMLALSLEENITDQKKRKDLVECRGMGSEQQTQQRKNASFHTLWVSQLIYSAEYQESNRTELEDL